MPQKLTTIAKETNYPPDAFLFVQRGLDYTVRRAHGEMDEDQEHSSRHVSGEQLCLGLRDLALDEYGLLARTVLKRWNIHSCADFGRIVFAMVDAKMMQKTDDDTIADFEEVYDFAEAFTPALIGEGI